MKYKAQIDIKFRFEDNYIKKGDEFTVKHIESFFHKSTNQIETFANIDHKARVIDINILNLFCERVTG